MTEAAPIPVARFLRNVLEQVGLPYGWGFKGYSGERYRGRDCSGVATSALYAAGGPDLRDSHNAMKLWTDFEPVDSYAPGVLCLYGTPAHVWHVMVCTGGGVVCGAAGGDSTTVTLSEALRRGARVQAWESHLAMPDFIGFRRIPYLEVPHA